MLKPTYLDAVYKLLDDKVHGGPIDGPIADISLHDGETPPTEEAIQTQLSSLKAEYDAQEYTRKRAEAYPTWQEQMDLLYHSGVEGLKAELKKTKDKYPKG